MSRIILLNKPFQVLSQFRDSDGRPTLKQYLPNHTGFYPAGRLDYDSEGLMLLTDDGQLQHRISDPKHKQPKTYWAQVEGIPDEESLRQFRLGLELKDGPTRPAKIKAIQPPASLWERIPPIRERQSIPTQWLEITLSEGRNRQVRRMTAAIGHPTLRLIRASIGSWALDNLQPGEFREETVNTPTLPEKRKPAPHHKAPRKGRPTKGSKGTKAPVNKPVKPKKGNKRPPKSS
ncbi:pseudouridine synthase [Pseudomaricurvus sp.]|uniref:pseudouridine synthase n=1 Tax=Pseudomaricurvus sp. TaxID=2004510 RepID=UPI003F6D3A6E